MVGLKLLNTNFPIAGLGAITVQYTAWCAYCSAWELLDISSMAAARVEWQRLGWAERQFADGSLMMVCPHCSKFA